MKNYMLLKNFGHEHLVGYIADSNFWNRYNIKPEWLNDPYWFVSYDSFKPEPKYTLKEMIAFGTRICDFFGHFFPTQLTVSYMFWFFFSIFAEIKPDINEIIFTSRT